MGIEGLNPFLRKHCPNAFIELPGSSFKGKRIAIDSDNILFRFKSRAYKEIVNKTDVSVKEPDPDEVNKRFVYHTKNFVINLIKIGATPIFVFDGDYIVEKSKTQEKRRADKKKMIDDAEAMKMNLLEIDELERTPAMVTELRKKMQNLAQLSKDEKEMMKGILSAIGIPVLTAKGEGEQLCAMLCIEGKVDAVYSRDTDLIAFGCPFVINEPGGYIYNEKTGVSEESLQCTIFKPILSSIGLEYDTFVDLCIMSGCDFNDNIPHLGVGKAYPILQQCKRIENLPSKYHKRCTCGNAKHKTCQRIAEDYEDQTECLNYKRCREIFSHSPSELICQDEIVLDIRTDLEDSRDRLEMYGAEDWLKDIVPLYQNVIPGSNTFIAKPPSLSRSNVKLNITGGNNKQPGGGPVLNIVDPLSVGQQRSSPKYVTNTQINVMNRAQHERLNKLKDETKRDELPKIKTSNKSIPVLLNILHP